MRFVRVLTLFALAVIVSASVYFAMPYVRAASLFVRVGNVGGPLERVADAIARDVAVLPRRRVPVRQGEVEAQLYRPRGTVRRSVLLVPGVHSMGIAEPRLTALAYDLAGSGVAVMTMAVDPKYVVIGGGLMDPEATSDAFRERYLGLVRETALPLLWPAQRTTLTIVPAALGDLSQSIGAALVALYRGRS